MTPEEDRGRRTPEKAEKRRLFIFYLFFILFFFIKNRLKTDLRTKAEAREGLRKPQKAGRGWRRTKEAGENEKGLGRMEEIREGWRRPAKA